MRACAFQYAMNTFGHVESVMIDRAGYIAEISKQQQFPVYYTKVYYIKGRLLHRGYVTLRKRYAINSHGYST